MGHPDKMADQISDGILDAILSQDPYARVACESLLTTGLVCLAGEITTTAMVDYPTIVRQIVREIGYTSSDMGFDATTCAVLVALGKQSPDIALGVDEDESRGKDIGAGDQGLMFGYASNETPAFMPLPIALAHRIINRSTELRLDGPTPVLPPDRRPRPRDLPLDARGDHPPPRPPPADLPQDRQRRPLRPFRARVHLGAHRQGRGPPPGRRQPGDRLNGWLMTRGR